MVQMRDGAVLLNGSILFSAPRQDFNTKAIVGQEFTVAVGDGFALLRLTNDDLARLSSEGVTLSQGSSIAALARPSAYAGEERMGNVTYRFVRLVTGFDLDALAHVVEPATAAKAA